jgi:urease accessory protein
VTPAPAIRHQRSQGEIVLGVERTGLRQLRESGAAKVRLPAGGQEAILINTGGGLASGDNFSLDISAGAGAALTVTTQAAERVYRSLGEDAAIAVKFSVGAGASLAWLPQETILYDGAALSRSITAHIAPGARFLAAESIVLGRVESGETVAGARLLDRWRVVRGGRLLHGEELRHEGALPDTPATLGKARAFATVLLVAEDVENLLDPLRAVIGSSAGASAWNGKLVARFAARDSFELRKSLIPALSLLAGGQALPKVWSL